MKLKMDKYRITHSPEPLKPVTEYIKGQGRFKHLTDDLIAQIQEKVNHGLGKPEISMWCKVIESI